MADPPDEPQSDEPSEKQRTKTIVRRLGYVVFIGGGFTMFLLMMVGVVNGIQEGKAWNPYTGKPVQEGKCLESARQLLMDAGEMNRIEPPWEGRYREWVTRCKDDHPDLYEVLGRTHSELQNLDSDDDPT